MSDNKNNKSMLLALLFFIGAGALLLFSISSEDASKVKSSAYSKQSEERVNSHLMLTNQKMELQRQRAQMDNNTYAPDYADTKAGKVYQQDNGGVDLSTESHADDVAKELGRGQREEQAPSNPHELIQSEVFNARQYSEYSEAYKKEYAKQFIENAARSGWKVKLNDDYKVISVTPLRHPSAQSGQMELFDGAGTSGQ